MSKWQACTGCDGVGAPPGAPVDMDGVAVCNECGGGGEYLVDDAGNRITLGVNHPDYDRNNPPPWPPQPNHIWKKTIFGDWFQLANGTPYCCDPSYELYYCM